VNSLHPGVVLTDIWRRLPGVQKTLFTFILKCFCKVCGNQKSAVALLINDIINHTCDWNSIFEVREELKEGVYSKEVSSWCICLRVLVLYVSG
jgi:hypothetical protein